MLTSGDGLCISLDRKERGAHMDFVSHAHSDHIAAAKSSKKMLASSATKELLAVIKNLEPQEAFDVPAYIKLTDAGHILGSKQIVVSDPVNGLKTVYTGDYQLQRSRACRPIEIEEADVAIVDSTYFQPEIQFDDRTETETTLQQWTEARLNSGIVLFGAYALGKAQELVSILNEKGILPIVTKKISRISAVYRNNGVKLDYASVLEQADDYRTLLNGNFVGIVENHLLPSMAIALSELYNKKVYTAVATGFAKMMRFNTDVQFPLSDHADFRQCIEYIEATGAKKIFTYGQNRLALAAELSGRGYAAMPYEG